MSFYQQTAARFMILRSKTAKSRCSEALFLIPESSSGTLKPWLKRLMTTLHALMQKLKATTANSILLATTTPHPGKTSADPGNALRRSELGVKFFPIGDRVVQILRIKRPAAELNTDSIHDRCGQSAGGKSMIEQLPAHFRLYGLRAGGFRMKCGKP